MLVPTQGLVLHTTAYAETSLIAKIFTRQLGVRSYIVKGVRKSGGRTKQNLFQPLSCLDLVVYDTPHAEINYIKDIAPVHTLPLTINESHSSILFFLDELLYRTLRDNEPMPELYDYIVSLIDSLPDHSQLSSLPIDVLLSVARQLGIAPLDNHSHREPLFNLSEGRFVAPNSPASPDALLTPDLSVALHNYIQAVYSSRLLPLYPPAVRRNVINALIDYYKHHLSYFGNFKSHEILHSVLA